MSVQKYLDLVTSEHNQRQKFMAMLAATLQPIADTIDAINGLPISFDLDTAIGAQLDIIGLWVGVTRFLQTPITNVYFAYDIAGLGWDQGVWLGPGESPTVLTTLPDGQFRTLIRARIANNHWDGSIPDAYNVGSLIFGQEPSSGFMFRNNIFTAGDGWVLSNCTTTQGQLSPDGTPNAWNWQRTVAAGAGLFRLWTGGTFAPANKFFTLSISGKPNSGNFVALQIADAGNAVNATFNVATGVVSTAPSGSLLNLSAAISPQLNGFYRCSLTAKYLPTSDRVQVTISGNANGTSVGGTDSASNTTVLFYGAQVEQAAAPTPYTNDITIQDNQDMTMTITVRGPALDVLTKALVTSGALDLSPAGVLATYVTP